MKIIWDKTGERFYETGVEQGVLYRKADSGDNYQAGVPWNGLTGVTESPSGAEPSPLYADNIKYLNLVSAEEFGATIEAYTYPDEFAQCDGSAELAPGVMVGQQNRKEFGLCYRTKLGNDEDSEDYGYKLHIIYNAIAAPSEKGYATTNDSPEAITFSWEVSTTPVKITGFKPSASIILNSTKTNAAILAQLEDILYGTANTEPRLPLPDEIAALFEGTGPEELALLSITPADDATVLVNSVNIVLTFNTKIQREAVVVASAAGVMVAGVKTWDAAGKILTFNPNANLSAGTTYIITIAGVVDVYGRALAPAVTNFAVT